MATLIPLPFRGELWLGNLEDAKQPFDERLCVLEGLINYKGLTWHIPILRPTEGNMVASRKQLDMAAVLIKDRLQKGIKLLVHCGAGIERAPLTCAWFLVHHGAHNTLEAAYAHLVALRPIVQDRQAWLEPA